MLSIQEKVNRLSIIGIEWMGPDVPYIVNNVHTDLPDVEEMDDDTFDKFCAELAPQLPTVIDKSMEVFKHGSAILRSHESISSKALAVGRKIETAWEDAYAITDSEQKFIALAAVDKRSNDFLVKLGDRLKEMREGRAMITQLMTRITALYTSQENMLDKDSKAGVIPLKLQARRNQYTKDRLAEEDRKKKEAKRIADKNKEAVDLRAWVKNAIGQALVAYQAGRKIAWTNAFNEVTLLNYEEKKANMDKLNTAFPSARLTELIMMKPPFMTLTLHTKDEETAIEKEEWAAYDFFSFYATYGQTMADLKKELQDKLPSKLAELTESKRIADKAEQDRLDELERQRLAEVARQKKLTEANNEKERLRLRRQGIQQRWDDRRRLNKIKSDAIAEQQRLENERLQREQDDANRINQEALQASQRVTSTAELGRVAGHAQSMFEETASSASSGKMPSSKQALEIKVLKAIGYVEIFTLWFERIGITLSIEEMGKKSLDQMKKDLESIATKAQKAGKVDQIQSVNLVYESTAKARNVREKAGE